MNKFRAVTFIPVPQWRWSINILWSIVSNAALRSRRMRIAKLPESIESRFCAVVRLKAGLKFSRMLSWIR